MEKRCSLLTSPPSPRFFGVYVDSLCGETDRERAQSSEPELSREQAACQHALSTSHPVPSHTPPTFLIRLTHPENTHSPWHQILHQSQHQELIYLVDKLRKVSLRSVILFSCSLMQILTHIHQSFFFFWMGCWIKIQLPVHFWSKFWVCLWLIYNVCISDC